ncbi:hypothetical protein H0A36_00390 [Endozoicomonas sp. SM1973]|uniref:Phage tail tape measure protein n=1 Tax=Spartinivicinus marinus TaxID=2994442 RepID=A0A853HZB8_9GAMM|nr:hypothetical protein [Spartinivicinus marinus]MCX4026608.1 hypothetical protein [Spartinivicinus marinus]NYZ64442.1 hypothetical protein [Spartinivicinus marinus]
MTDAVTSALNQLFDNNIAAVNKQAQAASNSLSKGLNNSFQSINRTLETKLPKVSQTIAETLNLENKLVQNSLEGIWQASGGVNNLLTNTTSALNSVKDALIDSVTNDIGPALLDNAQESVATSIADKLSINTGVVNNFVGDIRQAIANPFELAENFSAVGENLQNALSGDSAISLLQSLGDAHLPKVGQSIANALSLDESLVTGSLESIWQASGGADNLVNNFEGAFSAIKATAYNELKDVISPALLDNAQENLSNAIANKFNVNAGLVNSFVGDIRQAIGNPFELGDNLANVGGAIVELGQQHLASYGESLANNTAALISRRANLVKNTFATQGFSAGVKSLTRQFRLLSRLGVLKFKRTLSTLVGGIRLATAQFWLFNASILANPLVAIIAGIVAAVAVVGAIIYKYWEPIKAFMSSMFDGLISALGPVRQALAPIFSALEPIFSSIGSAINWIVDAFSNLFTPVQSTAAELAAFGSIGESVGNVLGTVFTFLLTPIALVAEGIGWLGDKVSAFADFAGGLLGGIVSFFGGDDDEDEDKKEKESNKKAKKEQQVKQRVKTVASQVTTAITSAAGNVVDLNNYRVAQSSNYTQHVSLSSNQSIGSIHPQRQNVVPIRSQATKNNVAVNAPITINATANQNPQEIAAMVKVELDKREQQAQLKQRGALYDIG